MPSEALLMNLRGKGIDPEAIRPKSKLGGILHRGGVADSPELRRILALPSYRWQDDDELEAVRLYLERTLALPPNIGCKRRCGHVERVRDCAECVRASDACVCRGDGEMHLRPVQVAALQAIHDFGGMLGPIRVGGGKTAISFLSGSILDAERVLLLIPAKLRDKTKRDFNLLAKHWRSPARLHVMSYELLSRDRGAEELEAYKPDLIVSDEAHKLKSLSAACTKRWRRYMKDHEGVHYVDMSGTTTKRSIKEYAHRYAHAVPDELQAVPRKYDELADWADAIDEKPSSIGRVLPGALLRFATEDEITEIARDPKKATAIRVTRQAFARRLLTAPGVVGTEDQFNGAMSLSITGREIDLGERVVEAFRHLRESWELPDGHPIETPIELWRHARELVQGFFYKWDPAPPTAWIVARREWSTMVREILKRYHDIDSPMVAAREVDSGRITWAKNALDNWRAIRPTFEPHTVAEWIDDSCLQYAAKWAKEHRGLIWVSEVAFGERLSKETGLPYYGAQGKCGGRMVEDERKSCIVSVAANSEGRNLQQFSENLVVSIPPGGAVWEQLIGRCHRDGQDADEVTVDAVLGCYEQWSVFRQARRDAEYIERTMCQSQKLNYADIEIVDEAIIEDRHRSGDPLWSKENARFFLDREAYSEDEMRVSAMRPDERAKARRG